MGMRYPSVVHVHGHAYSNTFAKVKIHTQTSWAKFTALAIFVILKGGYM